jgi:hypothetical protein
METVSPELDVAAAFARERRRQSLAKLGVRLRIVRDDVSVMLPLEEVLDALGRAGARDLGIRPIAVDSILGTVGRRRRAGTSGPRPGALRGAV